MDLASLVDLLNRVMAADTGADLQATARSWSMFLPKAEQNLATWPDQPWLAVFVASDGVASIVEYEWGPEEAVWESFDDGDGELSRMHEVSFTMLHAVDQSAATRPVNAVATHIATSPWSGRRREPGYDEAPIRGDVAFLGHDDGTEDAYLVGLRVSQVDGLGRLSLALSPACPSDVLMALAVDARGDEQVLEIPRYIGTDLVTESWNRLTRLAVARNPSAPDPALRLFAVDGEPAVRDSVQANPSASEAVRALAALH